MGAFEPAGIAERLERIRGRIRDAAARAGRDPSGVCLVAVTKGLPAAVVPAVVAAGVADIGENRVQEAAAKRDGVGAAGARWHLIGHLQTNKAALAARTFDVVHSLDSTRIVEAIGRHREPGAPLPSLVEVDLTGIEARTGAAAGDAEAIARAVQEQPALELRGLMTVAPPGDDEAARRCFRELRGLRDRLEQALGIALPELSMGMSADFEIAVEEGATIVRIGTALLGPRPG